MFKKSAEIENSLASDMAFNLRVPNSNAFVSALQHLTKAAELFDSTGNYKTSETITKLIEKMAK